MKTEQFVTPPELRWSINQSNDGRSAQSVRLTLNERLRESQRSPEAAQMPAKQERSNHWDGSIGIRFLRSSNCILLGRTG